MIKILSATTLLAAVIASAQPGRPRTNAIVAAVDTDRDGSISAAELANSAGALAALDKNKDGKLTADEIGPRFGAGGGPGRGQGSNALLKTLLDLDANSDGKLSKDEVPERMQGLFTRGDKNSDGVLSAEELTALTSLQRDPAREAGGPPMDPVRAALDTDRDGVISTAELSAAPTSLAKLDRNADGVLSQDELRPRFGGGRGGNPEEMYKRFLEANDANGDGKLSVAELPERMREFLGKADTDHDGFLSKEEMMAARPGGGGRPERRREER